LDDRQALELQPRRSNAWCCTDSPLSSKQLESTSVIFVSDGCS